MAEELQVLVAQEVEVLEAVQQVWVLLQEQLTWGVEVAVDMD